MKSLKLSIENGISTSSEVKTSPIFSLERSRSSRLKLATRSLIIEDSKNQHTADPYLYAQLDEIFIAFSFPIIVEINYFVAFIGLDSRGIAEGWN
jgi:hypothetical protein